MDISKTRISDWINPVKWVSFAFSIVMRVVPHHIMEQYIFRTSECKPCVDNGSCLHCGCAMPDKAKVPWESCSDGKWGPMFLKKKDWDHYKNDLGIQIIVNWKQQ